MTWLRFGLVVGFFLSALPISTHGQDVGWGLRAGPSISNLRGDLAAMVDGDPTLEEGATPVYVREWKARKGIQLTGFVTLPVRNWFSLQAELQYAQKGISIGVGEYENCGGPLILCRPDLLQKSFFYYRLSFLQLPALLKVRLPFGDAFRTHLVGGGFVGIPLRSELAAPDFWFAGETDIRSPDARTEIGAVMGLEMSYRLESAGTIVLDARLNPGFTDIPLEQSAASVRTSTFGMSLGYAFH